MANDYWIDQQPGPLIFTWRTQNILRILTKSTVISLAIHFKLKTSRSWIYTFRQLEAPSGDIGSSYPCGLSVQSGYSNLWIECPKEQLSTSSPPPVYTAARKGMLSSFTNSKTVLFQSPFQGANTFLVPLLVRLPSGSSHLESHYVRDICGGWKAGFFSLLPLSCQKHLPLAYNGFPYVLSSLLFPRRDNWTVWFPLKCNVHMQMNTIANALR